MSLIFRTTFLLYWLGHRQLSNMPLSRPATRRIVSVCSVACPGSCCATSSPLGLTLRVSKEASGFLGLRSTHSLKCNRCVAAACLANASALSCKEHLVSPYRYDHSVGTMRDCKKAYTRNRSQAPETDACPPKSFDPPPLDAVISFGPISGCRRFPGEQF